MTCHNQKFIKLSSFNQTSSVALTSHPSINNFLSIWLAATFILLLHWNGPFPQFPVFSRYQKVWCRNYVARTRLSRKSLSSVKRIKCRVSENKRNFLEIQCGREKSNLWDGGYQLSDGGKGKKKGRTVPFMHCSNEANKTSRFWKRPQNVVGCLDVRLL